MTIPYERIVQWAAGPTSILAGFLGTQISTHVGLLGQAGVGRDQVANAIYKGVVFVVGAGATYAAHHKWLDNLSKWWTAQAADAVPIPAVTSTPDTVALITSPQSAVHPDLTAPSTVA